LFNIFLFAVNGGELTPKEIRNHFKEQHCKSKSSQRGSSLKIPFQPGVRFPKEGNQNDF
jgi:hypothetical protein